jgi:hypothetical protein
MELAECGVSLVESGVFHPRQLQHMRAVLKRLSPGLDEGAEKRVQQLWARLRALERQDV